MKKMKGKRRKKSELLGSKLDWPQNRSLILKAVNELRRTPQLLKKPPSPRDPLHLRKLLKIKERSKTLFFVLFSLQCVLTLRMPTFYFIITVWVLCVKL